MEQENLLEIGKHTVYEDLRVFSESANNKVYIGKYCTINQNCLFVLSTQYNADNISTSSIIQELSKTTLITNNKYRGDIFIGNDVWIGDNVIIMPNVTIGDGAIIMEGSIILDDVKPYSVMYGNPAKLLYNRFSPTTIEKLLQIQWWNWPHDKVEYYADILNSSKVESLITEKNDNIQSKPKIEITQISNDNSTVYYRNLTSETINVTVMFLETYTNTIQYAEDIELTPNLIYWSSQNHRIWDNRHFKIIDQNTKETYIEQTLSGQYNIADFDYEDYIKNISNYHIADTDLKAGLLNVITEHFGEPKIENMDILPGYVVVDVGFNFGIFSLEALKNGADTVIGFEPSKRVFDIVEKYYPNQDKVILHNVAVSNYNGNTIYYDTDHGIVSSTFKQPDNIITTEYQVEVIDLYEFIKDYNVDFLKIDCEGEEYRIMRNIPDEYLKNISKIVLEYHFNTGPELQELINQLDRTNFNYTIVQNPNVADGSLGMIYAINKNIS